MRFLTPVVFACAAAYVGWFNATHGDRALILPFLDVLDPSVVGDPAAEGALTVKVLAGLAVVFCAWELGRAALRRRAPPEE